MAADISLLFDVLGEGSLSSGSGKEIKNGLENIVKMINNEGVLKVKVGIDTDTGGKKSWSSQLQEKLDQISQSGKFSVQISSLKLSETAVNDFRNQLNAIIGTMGSASGTEVSISTNGSAQTTRDLERTKDAIERAGSAASNTARKVSELGLAQKSAASAAAEAAQRNTDYEVQLREVKSVLSTIESSFNEISSNKNRAVRPEDVERAKELYSFVVDIKAGMKDGLTMDGLIDATETLRIVQDEFRNLIAAKKEFDAPGSEYNAQLSEVNSVISSIKKDFLQIFSGRKEMIRPEDLENARSLYVLVDEINQKIKNKGESLGIDGLRAETEHVRELRAELDRMIESKRAADTPNTNYEAELAGVKAIILDIQSIYKSIMSGKGSARDSNGNGLVSAEDEARAKEIYSTITQINRDIKDAPEYKFDQNGAENLRNLIPALREMQDDILKIRNGVSDSNQAMSESEAQVAGLQSRIQQLGSAIDAIKGKPLARDEEANVAELTAQYDRLTQRLHDLLTAKIENKSVPSSAEVAEIQAETDAISKKIEKLREERSATEGAEAAKKKENAASKSYAALLDQMQRAEKNWTAAKKGSSNTNYIEIQNEIAQLKEYKRQLDAGEISLDEFNKRMSETRSAFAQNANAIKSAGENVKTFGQRFESLAGKFGMWLSVTRVVMAAVRAIRTMIRTTIELDDAMTQLKIVTKDTDLAYRDYLDSVSKTAAKIGSSISDLIDSTTTYARLGYTLQESSGLAQFTAMLQNVGGIEVSDAQDAITSIVKAFGVNVDEIEAIMDKLVVTGNNFPISVSQIAEGMTNASSALAAAGNTFEQSVALLTAANTTIQNASKSSTGLRTIAARLRSTKTELENLEEPMTEAEHDAMISAITKYHVALTDINGEFRSTYDIVADIAAIWKDLSSMEQSALANVIAGTRQQAVFFSMVDQFQEASGAMDEMENSAGTLQESYNTYMESVTAHINQFKAAFQSLSESAFTTDFLKAFVDTGTVLLGVVEKLTDAFGLLGTVGLAVFGKQIYNLVQSAGRPETDGFPIVPAYALVATRNELAA